MIDHVPFELWPDLNSHGYDAQKFYQLVVDSPSFFAAVVMPCQVCGKKYLMPVGGAKEETHKITEQTIQAEYKALLREAGWDGKTGCPQGTFTKTFKVT